MRRDYRTASKSLARQAIPRCESFPLKYPISSKPEVDPGRKAAVCGRPLERYAVEQYLGTRHTQEQSPFSAAPQSRAATLPGGSQKGRDRDPLVVRPTRAYRLPRSIHAGCETLSSVESWCAFHFPFPTSRFRSSGTNHHPALR